jgi:sulfite reductase beta subunit-like hemoprotein
VALECADDLLELITDVEPTGQQQQQPHKQQCTGCARGCGWLERLSG